MSVFGEFRVPADALVLDETLDALPEVVVELDSAVATGDVVTPYLWVSGVALDEFEAAAAADPSVRDLRRLDEFADDPAGLYLADWNDPGEPFVRACAEVGAVVLEAHGRDGAWEIHVRFDDAEALQAFQPLCSEADVGFDVERLSRTENPRPGKRFGLTTKQEEALVVAWEAGHFAFPREATLEEVAAELDITQQSLSDRMRRAFARLLANTVVATSAGPTGHEG